MSKVICNQEWSRPMPIHRMLMSVFAGVIAFAGHLAAQANHDPERARLVTSDIEHFWHVVDHASLTNARELFQREYIDAGTPGLHDFVEKRIKSAGNLAATVALYPRYYAAIRKNTM